MKILYDSDIIQKLNNSNLFFDTTAVITVLNYQDLLDPLLTKLKEVNCTFLTIPSVIFEFLRGSDSLDKLNDRTFFIEKLAEVYPIEKFLGNEQLQDFTIILQRLGGQMSYTDFLLCLALYQFQDSSKKTFLLTENHKDFQISFLQREYIITLDNDKDIRNHGIYSLSYEKLEKAATNILKHDYEQ